MEEYIQLMAHKARRNDFPAIVYNDASTSNEEVSSEPTNIDIKPMYRVICIRKDTTPIEFDENIETNRDTPELAPSNSNDKKQCLWIETDSVEGTRQIILKCCAGDFGFKGSEPEHLNNKSYRSLHSVLSVLYLSDLPLLVTMIRAVVLNSHDRLLSLWIYDVSFMEAATLDCQITQLTKKINVLQEQNELFRAENGKIKQHYNAMSDSNNLRSIKQLNCQKTNVPVPPSTGVNSCTNASGSQPRSNTKKNRILSAKSVNMKQVEEHPRTIKSSLKTMNRVNSSISYKRTVINSNSHSVCQTCNKCLISVNHDMCVVTYLHSMNESPSV
ncbi:hypothetical protein Tco_1146870 [Tanacetum coccineum]